MRKNIILFLFFAVLWGACPAAADTLVALRPASEVRTAAIRLSDVFDGVPEAQDCDIALAPEPGKSVTYNLNVLTQLTQQYHLLWAPKSMTDASVLTRASTEITQEMVREKVLAKIKALDPQLGRMTELVFDNHHIGLTLPSEQKPDFELTKFNYNAQTRRFQTEIVVPSNGPVPLAQTVTGRLLVRREVPVLLKRLPAQTVIGPRDLTWQTVEEDRMPRDVLDDAAQIIGKELRADAQEGDMLRGRDLLPPRLVLRGSLVTIKIETPLMRITARGKALEDGAKGDVVRIANMQSKRVIEGTVEEAGVVRIDLNKKPEPTIVSDAAGQK